MWPGNVVTLFEQLDISKPGHHVRRCHQKVVAGPRPVQEAAVEQTLKLTAKVAWLFLRLSANASPDVNPWQARRPQQFMISSPGCLLFFGKKLFSCFATWGTVVNVQPQTRDPISSHHTLTKGQGCSASPSKDPRESHPNGEFWMFRA